MALTNDAKNAMLTELSSLITHVGLTTDADAEISGGSPAYARKAITWGTPSGGSMSASNQPAFDIPAGATVGKVKFYSDVTGGTLYGEYDVTNETYGGQGTYTVTSATIDLNK